MICGLRFLTGSLISGAIGGAGSTTRLAGGWFCIRGRFSVWARAIAFLRPRDALPRDLVSTEYHGNSPIRQRVCVTDAAKANGPANCRAVGTMMMGASEVFVARLDLGLRLLLRRREPFEPLQQLLLG